MSINCSDALIDNGYGWNHQLYSDKEKDGYTKPIMCDLFTLYESNELASLVSKLIANHNLNQSSEQIIGNLKQEIHNQQMSERFSDSFDYSTTQYGYIVGDSERVLTRK